MRNNLGTPLLTIMRMEDRNVSGPNGGVAMTPGITVAPAPTFVRVPLTGDQKRTRLLFTLGSIHGVGGAQSVSWPDDAADKKTLIYLRPQQRSCVSALTAFSKSACSAVCSIPGITEEQRRRFASSAMAIYSRPIAFEPLLSKSAAMICHGGAGTTALSLLAGVPLLMIPVTVEQHLHTKQVEALGAGIAIKGARLAFNCESNGPGSD